MSPPGTTCVCGAGDDCAAPRPANASTSTVNDTATRHVERNLNTGGPPHAEDHQFLQWALRNSPFYGNPAVRTIPDPWLCVPASRRVCPYRKRGLRFKPCGIQLSKRDTRSPASNSEPGNLTILYTLRGKYLDSPPGNP